MSATPVVPIVCNDCLGPDLTVTMIKAPRGGKCKLCNGPVDLFKWKPFPKLPFKSTKICAQCSKTQNLCPSCLLDFDFHLTKPIRDATIGVPSQAAPILAVGYTALQASSPSSATAPAGEAGEVKLLTFQGKSQLLEGLVAQRHQTVSALKGKRERGSSESIWVGQVDDGVTEESLRQALAGTGEIQSIKIVAEKRSAFVKLTSPSAAEEVLKKLGKSITIGEHTYPINYAVSSSSSKKYSRTR